MMKRVNVTVNGYTYRLYAVRGTHYSHKKVWYLYRVNEYFENRDQVPDWTFDPRRNGKGLLYKGEPSTASIFWVDKRCRMFKNKALAELYLRRQFGLGSLIELTPAAPDVPFKLAGE